MEEEDAIGRERHAREAVGHREEAYGMSERRACRVLDVHHSDQGVQYAATAYVARVEQLGGQISMAGAAEPRQNGSAERLMRTIKERGKRE